VRGKLDGVDAPAVTSREVLLDDGGDELGGGENGVLRLVPSPPF